MIVGTPKVIRPGAGVQAGVVGARGLPGVDGKPGIAGGVGPAAFYTTAAWQANVQYLSGPPAHIVTIGGGSYVCAGPHISGVFATDLANGYWQPWASKGDTGAQGIQGNQGNQGVPGQTGPAPFGPQVTWTSGLACVNGPPATFVTVPPSASSANYGSYVCLIPHQATTFDTDLVAGKWGPVAQHGPQGLPGNGSGNVNSASQPSPGQVAYYAGVDPNTLTPGGPSNIGALAIASALAELAAAGLASTAAQNLAVLQIANALGEIAGLGHLGRAAARQNIGALSKGRTLAIAIAN